MFKKSAALLLIKKNLLIVPIVIIIMFSLFYFYTIYCNIWRAMTTSEKEPNLNQTNPGIEPGISEGVIFSYIMLSLMACVLYISYSLIRTGQKKKVITNLEVI